MSFRCHSFTFQSGDCVMLCVGIFRFPIRSNAFPWTHYGCRCIVFVSKCTLCRSQPASMRGWSSLKKDLGIMWICCISIWVEELFEAVSENAQDQFTWLPCILFVTCAFLFNNVQHLVSQGHHQYVRLQQPWHGSRDLLKLLACFSQVTSKWRWPS